MTNPHSHQKKSSTEDPKIGKTILNDIRDSDIPHTLVQEFKDIYQFYINHEKRKKLSEMGYGEEGIVNRIEKNLKKQVAGMGIRVGKKIKMATKQPIKGPVVVTVDEATTSLGLGIADKIVVEVEK